MVTVTYETDRLEHGLRVAVHLRAEADPDKGPAYIRAKIASANQSPMRAETVEGRWAARGAIVDEHEFRFYGEPDPSLSRDGRPGIRVECSCGAVHRLEGGHTMNQLIRLTCNDAGIT